MRLDTQRISEPSDTGHEALEAGIRSLVRELTDSANTNIMGRIAQSGTNPLVGFREGLRELGDLLPGYEERLIDLHLEFGVVDAAHIAERGIRELQKHVQDTATSLAKTLHGSNRGPAMRQVSFFAAEVGGRLAGMRDRATVAVERYRRRAGTPASPGPGQPEQPAARAYEADGQSSVATGIEDLMTTNENEQSRGKRLSDLDPEIQQVANWVAKKYAETGIWPSQAWVWREISIQKLHHEIVSRGNSEVFDYLGSPPSEQDPVRLRPWVLYDSGACSEAFERAYEVYQDVQARLHTEEKVTIARRELGEKYGLPFASKELHQLIWVLFSAHGGPNCGNQSTDSDWHFTFTLGFLKSPIATLEEVFVKRPTLFIPNPAQASQVRRSLLVEVAAPAPTTRTTQGAMRPDPRKVFIIHGRNTQARDQMEIFLQSLELEPVRFGNVRASLGGTPTIAEVVENGMAQAQGVIALFTADEYAAVRPEYRELRDKPEDKCRWQARPNVIFEAGMAFGRARTRVVFVLLGDPALCSDLAGIHVLTPKNDASPQGSRALLRQTLMDGMGCQINPDSAKWETSGDFEGCVPPSLADGVRDPFESIDPKNSSDAPAGGRSG